MPRRAGIPCLLLLLTASICSSQSTPAHSLEITLPTGLNSEGLYIRYVLAGETLGGLVPTRPGVASYFIDTTLAGRSASGIKALLYAPGCAIQTLDLLLSNSTNPRYSFICAPLPAVSITGTITHPDPLYDRGVNLQTRYIARWAAAFLGLDANTAPIIPVGDASDLSSDGRFHISVPDLSPRAGMPDRAGELQIWAKDKASGDLVALLIPAGPQAIKTRMGGLKILSEYPSEIVFAPCALNSSQLHDREGFALRSGVSDACGC